MAKRDRRDITEDEFVFDEPCDDELPELDEDDAAPETRFEVPPPAAPPPGSPELELRLDVRYEWGSLAAKEHPVQSLLVTIRPEGPTLAELTGGPSAHLILALDVSASMDHPDKLPVLAEALTELLEELHETPGPDVLLSVIVFAKGAKTLYQAIPASRLDAEDLLDAVRATPLLFGRYSDAVGALSRATRIALDSHRRNLALPVRIVLLTDGKLQDVEGARHKVARIAHMPIDVGAIAFGADSDVDRLKQVVGGQRGGTVKHARADTLGGAFRRLAVWGRNVGARLCLLRFETAAGVVGGAAYRFRPARHAYGEDAFERGRVFETDIGTLEVGRTYSLLFQVRLPQTGEHETEIGRLTLRVPGFGGPQEIERFLGIPRHRGAQPVSADPLVTEARAVLDALDHAGPNTLLQSLRARRKLYLAERRDPYLLAVVDKAIREVEAQGDLDGLSNEERAALSAHTMTVDLGKPRYAGPREYHFG